MSDGFRAARTALVEPDQVHCHVADMTVTVGGAVPLRQLWDALREHRQWLAVDGDESRPIGELIQENSTGPLRLGYGGWRDILLGCQFQNGRGELITVGAQTMKNVAGYDLTKFMIGQRGIFGKIVTVTARTYRLPDGALTARFSLDPARAAARLTDLLTTDCKPQWALIDAQGLICGYLGDEPTLAYLRGALRRFEPQAIDEQSLERDTALRRRMLEDAWSAAEESSAQFRASIPPASVKELIHSLLPSHWVADGVFGVVWGTAHADAPTILQAAQSVGGGAAVWQGGRYVAGSRPSEPVGRLVRRLKAAFDPDGTLPPLPMEYS